MRTKIYVLVLLVLAQLFFFVGIEAASARTQRSNTSPDPIDGLWYTENHEGGVELYSCDNKICGRFYWFKPGKEEKAIYDQQNPDPEKRGRLLCKLQFMGDFTSDGKGHYSEGWIYSPRHGQTFNAEMTLIDHDTLSLHGYVIIPLLGDDQIWKRTKHLHACVS